MAHATPPPTDNGLDAEIGSMRLPAALDLSTVASLTTELLAFRGRPLRLDASGVRKVGALGVQVLLSAQLTWVADGVRLEIDQAPESLVEQMALLGVDLSLNGEMALR